MILLACPEVVTLGLKKLYICQLIEIKRLNCIYGYWGYPDGHQEPEWLNHADMPLRYINEKEGREVDYSELRHFSFTFIPDRPEEIHGHGVPGTLRIIYHYK